MARCQRVKTLPYPHTMLPANPHRVVAAKIKEHEKENWLARQYNRTERELTPVQRRILFVEDILFKAAERRGYRVEYDNRERHPVSFVVGRERIRHAIWEHIGCLRVPLTAAELRKNPDLPEKKRWKVIEKPTGTLVLSEEGVYRGIGKYRRAEKADHLLEQQIDDILLGLEKIAAEVSTQRTRDEEEKRRQKERAAEKQRSRDIEESRWEAACDMAHDLWQAQRLREVTDALAQRMPQKPHEARRLVKWLRWMRAHIDRIDPLANDMETILTRLGLEKR